jgi:hypothetical protein
VLQQESVAVGRLRCLSSDPLSRYTIWVRMAFQWFDPQLGLWVEVPGTEANLVESLGGDSEVPCVNQHHSEAVASDEQALWRATFELRRPVRLPPLCSQPFRARAPAQTRR